MSNEPIIPTRSAEEIRADVGAELNAFIEERAAELVKQGTAPGDARAQAAREFGDASATERYCADQDAAADRRVRIGLWIEEFFADMRIAARSLRRTPGVAAVVLATFALGIGATAAVFSAVHALLLKPLPYADEASLVALPSLNHGVRGPGGEFSAVMLRATREQATSFAGVAGIGWSGFSLTGDGDPEFVYGARLTANTFDVLGVRPARGRAFVTGDDSTGAPPVVVLSDGLWRRRYGADSAIVGRFIDVSGTKRQVIGVMPRGFTLPTFENTQAWVPLNLSADFRLLERSRKFRYLHVFARLRPGATRVAARADLDRTMRALTAEAPDAFEGITADVIGVRDMMVGDVKSRLLVLMGAAAFVLLIACANIAGVLLSRAVARSHELAVRVALGAGRRRLVRQFLAEGAVITIVGALLGVAVGAVAMSALRVLASHATPGGTELSLSPSVLAFTAAVAIASGMLFSLVPALGGTRVPGLALRSGSRGSAPASRRSLRLALVAGQLCVSVVLLVAAGLFLRTLNRLNALDLGYRTDNVMSFRVVLPGARYPDNAREDQFWPALYREIGSIPGVTVVGGAGNVPMGGSSSAGLAIEGRPDPAGQLPEVKYAVVSDDFFHTLDIPLTRGRAFGPHDVESVPPVVIVSASLAQRFWPGADPLGARIRLGPDPKEPWATIVGVVGDVRLGIEGDARPTAYVSQRQDHWRSATVVVRSSAAPIALAKAVRQAVARVDPLLPITDLQTLDEFQALLLGGRRSQTQFMLGFALLALVLSAIGVYGVSSYAVEARRREFGIRMALGATRQRVLILALGDGARAAMLGVIVGVPLALILATQARSLLFQVEPFDPPTVAIVLGVLGLVVLAASLVPARRATKVDPVRAMRAE